MMKKMDKKEEKMSSAVSVGIKGKQIGTMYIARDEGVCYDEDECKNTRKASSFL